MAIEDKVNQILGLEPAKTPMEELHKQEEFKAPVVRTEEKDSDVDNDHKNSREHYYNLIKNALFVGSTAELQKMLKKDDEVIESKTITPEEADISNK